MLNRGAYFMAHEALESAWRQESGPVRDLYRGLLQAAVVYLHIERGNYAGAVKVYQRCLKWLRPWLPHCQGICIDSLLADLAAVVEEVRNLGPDHIGEFGLNHIKPVKWCKPDPATGAGMLCDRCGHEMIEYNCKLLCPNCGNRFDCSDLTLYFD